MKTFGQILRQKRKAKGLTQEDLAKEIGTAQQVVSSWEKEQRWPTLFNAICVADALDCSIDELVGKDMEGR